MGHEAAAVQQRRCPQLSYSLAVSAAVLLKLLKKNKIACYYAAAVLKLLENNTIKSSTEKQSSAIVVHKPKRTATSTRTIHTRQNNPYRLGAAPAGVVGARSRCCPAATVPAAVAFATGLGCCFAEIANKKQNSLLLRLSLIHI